MTKDELIAALEKEKREILRKCAGREEVFAKMQEEAEAERDTLKARTATCEAELEHIKRTGTFPTDSGLRFEASVTMSVHRQVEAERDALKALLRAQPTAGLRAEGRYGPQAGLRAEAVAEERAKSGDEELAREIVGWWRSDYDIAEDALAPAIVAALAAVRREERERCAVLCDAVAANPPPIDVDRSHWHVGHQDGAMECVAAIRGQP